MPITIQIDSREKPKAIKKIEDEFKRQGVKFFTNKLFVGDYMSLDNPKLSVDRKHDLNELVTNLGGEKCRFYREAKRAAEYGIKLIVLCEHGKGITCIEDVKGWDNPRLNPKHPKYCPTAMTGRELMERIYRIHISYGVEFRFCEKAETGKEIIRILGGSLRE